MKFIELSHRIYNGMKTFPGIPDVKIDNFMNRKECADAYGCENAQALLDRIQMVNISGTYLDSPLHRFENGYNIADIPLEKIVDLPYEIVTIQPERNYFDVDDFENTGIKDGAVILNSGHYKKFGKDSYSEKPPYLTVDGAQYLIKKGVVFIGIDSPLIDNMETNATVGCPVHDVILSAGAIVCEDMNNLDALNNIKNGLLTAVPALIEMASFTARVYVKY